MTRATDGCDTVVLSLEAIKRVRRLATLALCCAAATLGGCGSSSSHVSSSAPATAHPSTVRQPSDQRRARQAVIARLGRQRRPGVTVSCRSEGRERFACVVGNAELWQAVIGRDGSVHLHLVGSD